MRKAQRAYHGWPARDAPSPAAGANGCAGTIGTCGPCEPRGRRPILPPDFGLPARFPCDRAPGFVRGRAGVASGTRRLECRGSGGHRGGDHEESQVGDGGPRADGGRPGGRRVSRPGRGASADCEGGRPDRGPCPLEYGGEPGAPQLRPARGRLRERQRLLGRRVHQRRWRHQRRSDRELQRHHVERGRQSQSRCHVRHPHRGHLLRRQRLLGGRLLGHSGDSDQPHRALQRDRLVARYRPELLRRHLLPPPGRDLRQRHRLLGGGLRALGHLVGSDRGVQRGSVVGGNRCRHQRRRQLRVRRGDLRQRLRVLGRRQLRDGR